VRPNNIWGLVTLRLMHLGLEAHGLVACCSLEVQVLRSGLGTSLARGLDGNSRIPPMASPTLHRDTVEGFLPCYIHRIQGVVVASNFGRRRKSWTKGGGGTGVPELGRALDRPDEC